MTNKIKENIIIFWGGLAICLYIEQIAIIATNPASMNELRQEIY